SVPVRNRLRNVLPPRVAPMLGQLVASAERRMARLGVEPMPPPQALATPARKDDAAEQAREHVAGPAGDRGEADVPPPEDDVDDTTRVGRSSADHAIDRVAGAERDARRLGTSPLANLAADDRLRVLPTLQPVV